MRKLVQDIRYAVRQLGKNPGFTVVAIITLALGIGANTAIFSVLYASLLAPLPYPDADRLMMVWSKVDGRTQVSAGDYLDWKRQNKAFEDMVAWTGGSFNLATPEQPEMVDGRVVTPGFFRMQGIGFFLGRDFLPEEGSPGKDHAVILTHKTWERLGSDRNIIGKSIRINNEPYAAVGVLAPGLADRLTGGDLSVPLAFKPEQLNHDAHWLVVMGKLKPGVSREQAQSDMNVVADRIAQDFPKSNKGWSTSVEPLHNDFLPPELIKNLWLLMAAVAFVLLIACANVANLLLTRGMSRQKEIAVRTSLGATRVHIFGQFLTESLILAGFGGVIGVALGEVLLRILMANMPFDLPSEADIRLSLPVLLFTVTATTLAGVLFGCAPAWQATRVNLRVNLNETLKEGGRTGTSGSKHRLRRILVVAEFALALTLLAAAGLAMHSFWNVTRVDLGIRKDHVLTFFLPVPQQRFNQPEEIGPYYRQILEKIHGVPGVVNASASTGTPLQGIDFSMFFSVSGKPVGDPSLRPSSPFLMVTPGYYETYGIRVVRGRSFTEQDSAKGTRVAMVNENFVRNYLPGVDPLTQTVSVDQLIPGVTKTGDTVPWQIVGVFHNVRGGNLRADDSPEIDVPFWQSPWPTAGVAVRTNGDPEAMIKSLAAAIHGVDPDLPLAGVRTMDQILDQALLGDQFIAAVFGGFAGVALLLAAVGIYGVMAFGVAQRTHEIGLRIALGAGQGQVLGLILREGLLLALAGLGFGLLGAYFLGRAMQSTLYGVGAIDFSAFGAVAAVLLVSALAACYLPARRAAKIDPMVALRYE
jgi:putative ABC transport system permease protein